MTYKQAVLRSVGAAALVVGALWAVSFMRQGPGGPSDNLEWLLTYLFLLGVPTSLGVSVLLGLPSLSHVPYIARVAFSLAVCLNWVLIVVCARWLVSTLNRRLRPKAQHGTGTRGPPVG